MKTIHIGLVVPRQLLREIELILAAEQRIDAAVTRSAIIRRLLRAGLDAVSKEKTNG
jgi:hypothetical protein